jgi:serine/threonine protein kinase
LLCVVPARAVGDVAHGRSAGDRRDLRDRLAPGVAGRFLPVGEVVDRYVIRGAIGAGAMGVVYAARDPALERDVAIKVVKVARGEDLCEARARLLCEARALARLSHPNVVAVYDAGTHGHDMFIALELFDGPNLRDWLRTARRGRAEIVDALLAAGRGLAAAHAAGIVHRESSARVGRPNSTSASCARARFDRRRCSNAVRIALARTHARSSPRPA